MVERIADGVKEISIRDIDFDSYFESLSGLDDFESEDEEQYVEVSSAVFEDDNEYGSEVEIDFGGSLISEMMAYTEVYTKVREPAKQEVKKSYLEERMESINAAREKFAATFEDRIYRLGEMNKYSRYPKVNNNRVINLESRIKLRAREISRAKTPIYVSRIWDMITR